MDSHVVQSDVMKGMVDSATTFAQVCAKLHEDLEVWMETNIHGKRFMPRKEPYDFFVHNREHLSTLYRCAASEEGIEVNQNTLNDDIKTFLAGVIKKNDEASRGENSIATIFAVLLAVNKIHPIKSSSQAWKTIVAACKMPQEFSWLKDKNLPLSKEDLHRGFGEMHGSLFHNTQCWYHAHVLKREKRIRLTGVAADETPLPYLKQELIGRGAYGKVYRTTIARGHVLNYPRDKSEHVEYSDEPQVFARKDIVRVDPSHNASHIDEWEVFELIKKNRSNFEEFIQPTLACFEFENHISLFMELAECDLASYMQCNDRPLFPKVGPMLENITNLAGALMYLHEDVVREGRKVVCYHLDLKPQNILVVKRNTATNAVVFKLADFSISCVRSTNDPGNVQKVDDIYSPLSRHDDTHVKRVDDEVRTSSRLGDASTCIAPEATGNGNVTEKADLWSFGCVLSIFLSWLIDGREGPSAFAKERVQASSALNDDRFFAVDEHGREIVNSAVSRWLAPKCKQVTSVEKRTYSEELHKLIVGNLLKIDSNTRIKASILYSGLDKVRKGYSTRTQTIQTSHILGADHSPDAGSKSKPKEDLPLFQNTVFKNTHQFRRVLAESPHENPGADVLQKDLAIVSWSDRSATISRSSSYQNDVTRLVSWKALATSEIVSLLAGPKLANAVAMYGPAVSFFNITGSSEDSESYLVTHQDSNVQCCAIGSEWLCLAPKSETLLLDFYRISTLGQENPRAIVMQSPATQPQAIALHPERPEILACVFVDNHNVWQLFVIEHTSPSIVTNPTARGSSEPFRSWRSRVPLEDYESAELTGHGHLEFSRTGDRLSMIVKHEYQDIRARVFMWSLQAKEELHKPDVILQIDNKVSRCEKPNDFLDLGQDDGASGSTLSSLILLAEDEALIVYDHRFVWIEAVAQSQQVRLPGEWHIYQAMLSKRSSDIYLLITRSNECLEAVRTKLDRRGDVSMIELVSAKLISEVGQRSDKEPYFMMIVEESATGTKLLVAKSSGTSELINLEAPSRRRQA